MAEATKVVGAYDFDPAVEPADVEIEILPHRYVQINGQTYYPERKIKMDERSGSRIIEWDTSLHGQVKVSRRVADELTMPSLDEAQHGVAPVARVVEQGPKAKTRRSVATEE